MVCKGTPRGHQPFYGIAEIAKGPNTSSCGLGLFFVPLQFGTRIAVWDGGFFDVLGFHDLRSQML